MFINAYLWSHVKIVVKITKYKKLICIKDGVGGKRLNCRLLNAVSMPSNIFLVHFLLIETMTVSYKMK